MWRKYFKLPFENDNNIYIKDADGHPVCNFTARMTDGSYDNIVAAINGDYIPSKNHSIELSENKSEIILDGISILKIRGWGYLIGTGGCHLTPEKAADVQDSLAEYICEQLR